MTDYFVSDATGDDTDTGLTEALAFKTVDKAFNTYAAGDTVFIKDDGTYTETATVDTAGTSTAPVIIEGYITTPGDGGFATVTIDGESTRTNCLDTTLGNVAIYHIFKSIRFTGCTGDGINLGSNDAFQLRHCRLDNNASDGIDGDNNIILYRCQLDNNTQAAVNLDVNCVLICCSVHDNGNTTRQAEMSTGDVLFTEFYGANSAAEHMRFTSSSAVNAKFWINNTIDGEGGSTTDGVNSTSASSILMIYMNSIFYDLDNGILRTTDIGELWLIANCLFNSNATTDKPSNIDEEGTVTGAPQFTDEVAHDYTLASGSPAIDAGIDAADAKT